MNDATDFPELEDPSLADLVDRLTAALHAGQSLDLQDCLRQYPEHADRLRALWPALRALAEAGRDVEHDLPRAGRFDQLGQVLGDYRIVRPLGRGGMGVVYEAVQESLGRHVALKVLPLNHADNPTWLERFKREAQAAARLHHTNIVPVFGVGEDQGRHYYAMQFIPGKGLDVVLSERRAIVEGSTPALPAPETPSLSQGSSTGPCPPPAGEIRSNRRVRTLPGTDTLTGLASQQGELYYRNVARIGLQVAEALEHAHAQGVLHRDIKPSNLLLDEAGVVWVTDFGLARLEGAAELTAGDTVLGTLRYMAPERFQGRSDARGDIYSLGATLYEMLTLRPVVEDIDPLRVVEQVGRSSPILPRKLKPDVPRDLETIVLKALDPRPEARYATAGDMVEDLRRFLADLPILARRSPWWERLARWRRNNPSLAAALVLALLTSLTTAVVAGLFAAHKTRDARQLRDQNAEVDRKRAEVAAALDKAQIHLRQRQHYERQASLLALERGLRLGEAGKGHLALLWMARALELYPGGDPTLEEAIRLNLSAWSKRLRPLLHRLEHRGTVQAAALSPDGQTLVAATQEGDVYFWDVETGRALVEPIRRVGRWLCLGFSPGGKTVLVAGGGKAQLFESRTGKPAGPEFRFVRMDSLVFNGEGDRVLLLRNMNQAQLWDPLVGKPLSPILRFSGRPLAATFSRDGKKVMVVSAVISSGDSLMELSTWDALNGLPLGNPLRLFQPPSRMVRFTPDHEKVVTCSPADGSVRVWDVATGRQQRKWQAPVLHNAPLLTLAPNCQAVAVQDRNRLALLNSAGSLLHNRIVLPSLLTVVQFSPDSRLLLTGTDATDCAVGQLWDTATGLPVGESVAQDAPVRAMYLTADGRRLLTVDGQSIRIWGAEPSTDRVGFPGANSSGVSYAQGGRLALVLTKDGLILWDVPANREVGRLPVRHNALISVSLSDDARVVALIEAQKACVWHRGDGEPRCVPLLANQASGIALSPDARVVCTTTKEARIQLWDAFTGKPLSEPQYTGGSVQGLQFTSDGRAVLFWTQPLVQRLERENNKITRIFGPEVGVSIKAVSPDNRRLLLTRGGQTWLHDLEKQNRQDLGGDLIVQSAHFSADGRVVLAAGQCPRRNRPLLRMWDAATGQPRGRLLEMPHQDRAYPGPDGTFALVRVSLLDYQLIHFPSGQAIGPLIRHASQPHQAAFAPDGKTVLTSGGFHAWLSRVPRPLAGDAQTITAHVQALTGLELDEGGQAQPTKNR